MVEEQVEVEEGVSVERGMIGLVAAVVQSPVHPGKWQKSTASVHKHRSPLWVSLSGLSKHLADNVGNVL